MVAEARHDGDGGSTYVAGMLQYVEELILWILMILVDGYQDDMLSRTTTISGGGGCNVPRSPPDVRRVRATDDCG